MNIEDRLPVTLDKLPSQPTLDQVKLFYGGEIAGSFGEIKKETVNNLKARLADALRVADTELKNAINEYAKAIEGMETSGDDARTKSTNMEIIEIKLADEVLKIKERMKKTFQHLLE